MKHPSRRSFLQQVGALTATAALGGLPARAAEGAKPNIVIILADDLGYGDVQALNPESKIPTPNIDRLAKEGMAFTDAHTPSAVCTPTRYGLLTGRYCWRSPLKTGVLGGYSRMLIEKGRQTLPAVLKKTGYHTACVGKWHLGVDWPWSEGKAPGRAKLIECLAEPGEIDYSKPVLGGPTDVGFDTSYIIPASLDMSPYVYLHDRKVTKQPDRVIPRSPFPAFWREAEISPDFVHEEVLDHLLGKANDYLRSREDAEDPFFLYFPMTAPHKPVIPHARFEGKTDLGPYGDFIVQVDWTVGQVLKTLDETGQADNTLVILTSDNGSYMYRYDDDRKDHVDDEKVQGYRSGHHRANDGWRGTKADIWEAGHRVPFFARWPGHVAAGTREDTTISLTDLLATLAGVAGGDFDPAQAPDSYAVTPLLDGKGSIARAPVIHHSGNGMFSVREGRMKLILGDGSGGRQQPRGKPFGKPYQLYDIEADPGEKKDLAAAQPEVVARLEKAFLDIAGEDTPRAAVSRNG